jgi:hypothetical protein
MDKYSLVAGNCSRFEARSSSLSSSSASSYCNCNNCEHFSNEKCEENLFDSVYRIAKSNDNANKRL